MPSGFRKTLLWLHTWVGLTIGLAMVFLAVTGGVLVMRPHFEHRLERRLVQASECDAPISLDALAARARAAHPQGKLDSLEVSAQPSRSVAVKFANKDLVYLDPCTARVLGAKNQYGGLFGVMDWLHRFRFMEGGRAVAGWLNAAILIFLVMGGVVLWWPRSRAGLKTALTYNPRLPGVARTLSLHRVLGAYGAALLLVLTLTGLPFSFDWAKQVIAWSAGSSVDNPRPRFAPVSGPREQPSMDLLWARAKAVAPDLEWVVLKYPKANSPAVEVEMLEPGAPHEEAKSYLYLEASTGRVLKFNHFADLPPGRKAYLFILAIHSGLVGGAPYQLALLLVCLAVPVQAYSGFSPYIRKRLRKGARSGLTLRVVARRMEAEDVCAFELADPRGKPLPAFSAGSHVDVRITPDLVRQYSLCNDPAETHRYVIAIRRRPDSRGGSRTLHETLQVGDALEVSPPRNHFPLAHGAEHSLLIAGGIGITPILCMAERLANVGASFELHYCVTSLARAPFRDRIEASTLSSRTSLHVSDTGGRLDVSGLLAGQPAGAHVYVCGPTPLIEAVVEAAGRLGWDDARVHREHFAAVAHDTTHDKAFDVKVASTGLRVRVEKDQSVIQALAAHGIEIPTSCGEGVCGTCLTRVLEGTVEHRDVLLTDEERSRHDQFTPCCSRAADLELVLDL